MDLQGKESGLAMDEGLRGEGHTRDTMEERMRACRLSRRALLACATLAALPPHRAAALPAVPAVDEQLLPAGPETPYRLPHRAALPVVPTVDEQILQASQEAPLRMLFQGTTPHEFHHWQGRFAGALRRLIGAPAPPTHWSATRLSTVTLADHVREEWLLESPDAPSVPLYVLCPAPQHFGPGPFPVVMCLHGHGPYGHDAVVGIDDTPERATDIGQLNYDYARQLVRQGFLTVAPCLLPFGRRLDKHYHDSAQDPCATTFVRLMLLGHTLIGANLRDVQWTLDYVLTRPDAHPTALGCVGLSTGGRMTMLATALDARIRVAVIAGALNVMQERIQRAYTCGAQVIPGLLTLGDTPEIGALIAPRPCLWAFGRQDPLIVPSWADKARERLSRAYTAAGTPEALQFHRHAGGHRWDGSMAVPLLHQVLGAAGR